MLQSSGRCRVSLLGCCLLGLGAACEGSASNGASDVAYGGPLLEGPAPPPIEESNLYRLDGNWLYVQSDKSGLNVIDVSRPRQPRQLHQLPISGRAGELYVEDATAFVLLEEASPPCRLGKEFGTGLIATTSQLVAVERATTTPEISAPRCVPGTIIRQPQDWQFRVRRHDLRGLEPDLGLLHRCQHAERARAAG